jgi:hypothetical protein
MVTNFIWNELFYLGEKPYSNDRLTIAKDIQFRVVQEIVRRSSVQMNNDMGRLKTRNEVYKCLFFRNFEKSFLLKSAEQRAGSISDITTVQREVALLGMEESSRNRKKKENEVLAKIVSYIIRSSSKCYKNKMIENNLLETACLRMGGEAIKGVKCVSMLFTGLLVPDINLLSKSDRSFVYSI